MTLDATTFPDVVSRLADDDPALSEVVAVHGVPDFWHRPPGFATLALFIVEQQVSLASAKAVFERLVDLLGEVNSATVTAADLDELGRAGLTRQKQRYLKELSRAVSTGRLDLEALERLSDVQARAALTALPGIGPWTADVYLLAALRRADVWPVGDRALQVGVGEILGLTATPGPDELESIGDRWRPHRSAAARLIWHAYLRRRNRQETAVAGLGPVGDGRGS